MMLATASGAVVFSANAAQAATPACTRSTTKLGVNFPSTSGGAYKCQLSYGDNNDGVASLQWTLIVCYGGSTSLGPDGHFGPATQAALKKARAKAGVTADGIYGPNTATHLKWQDRDGAGACLTLAQHGVA